MYSTFNQVANDATLEPMFLGNGVNVSRYDQQKYPFFEKLIEKQLSFFWRPEEVDVSKDRSDFLKLPEHEKHIFLSNLKYQILLDSVQGRSPNVALLPLVSLPELETWIETWSFSEVIHSRSYTHIIRNVVTKPEEIFDNIVTNEKILERATSVTKYYDDLIALTNKYHRDPSSVDIFSIKKQIYLTIMSINILEAIRFYVSFACSFAFAERELMEGNAKIVKLIARDEALHLSGTQHMIQIMQSGKDDPDMKKVADSCKEEVTKMFIDAADQEKEWAEYLFKDGSMIGLNKEILSQYVEYITTLRMQAVGLVSPYKEVSNPIPWVNSWLVSDNVQVAPQESEISSYLVGQVDSSVEGDEFSDFDL